jgi:hypothetical protein
MRIRNPAKNPKKQKKTKKTTGLVFFFFLNPGFFQPCLVGPHVEAEALALLLDHGAELVADEAEDVFDLGEVDVGGRPGRVRRPQGDVRGGGVLHTAHPGCQKTTR